MQKLIKLTTYILASIVLFFSFFHFFIKESQAIHLNRIPSGDGPAYLETAISVEENGGVLKLIPRMLSGDYKEANRHPLYISILATVAERDLSFFVNAKIITFGMALVYLLLVFIIFQRLKNTIVALVSVALFATNYFFIDQTAKVSTEPLFMIFVLLSWWVIVESFQATPKRSFVQGAVTSLAYLSKVTGLFVVAAYIMTHISMTLLEYNPRSRLKAARRYFDENRKSIGMFMIGFTVVALPLFWRNMLVYQNPFYNYNGKLLWISSGSERRAVNLYRGDSQSITTFLRAQTAGELAERVGKGMIGEAVVVLQLVAFEYGRIRGSIIIFLLFAVALFRDKRRSRAFFSFYLVLGFYLFFSWYFRISGHFRYLLPVLFVFYFYLVSLAYDVYVLITRRFIKVELASVILTIALLIPLGLLAQDTYEDLGFLTPLHSVDPSSQYLDLIAWVKANISRDDLFMNGPGHEYQVEWLTGTSNQSLEMPATESFSELSEFIIANKVRYVVVSPRTIERRKELLGEYFRIDERGGVIELKTPKGWILREKDSRPAPKYFIYEANT